MATTLPLAEVRSRLSPLIGSVEQTHERIVITKNGKPAAVLISYDDLMSLEETLDILADPDAVSAIRASLADESRFTLDEVRRELTERQAASAADSSTEEEQPDSNPIGSAVSSGSADLLRPTGRVLHVKPGYIDERVMNAITATSADAQTADKTVAELQTSLKKALASLNAPLEVITRGSNVYVLRTGPESDDIDVIAALEGTIETDEDVQGGAFRIFLGHIPKDWWQFAASTDQHGFRLSSPSAGIWVVNGVQIAATKAEILKWMRTQPEPSLDEETTESA